MVARRQRLGELGPTMADEQPNVVLISFQDVSYVYRESEETAVHDINFELRAGERVAFIGASGSGKSTLARLLTGLLHPTTGKIIRSNSHRAGETPPISRQSSTRIAMVFQNPDNQFVSDIVEDDVAFGPENLGWASDRIQRAVDEALQLVGADHLRRRMINTLSGGEKQRVALAGALAMRPSCLVLDEASSMLPPGARMQLEQSLQRIRKERLLTLVQMTHDAEEAIRADRVFLLRSGRIHAVGSPDGVLDRATPLRQCGIRPLDVTVIASTLTSRGVPIQGAPLTTDALVRSICEAISN